MKKTIFILLTFVSLATYGQEASTSASDAEKQKDRFTCQYIEVTADKKKIFLRENVKIETENLVLQADSAVFDKENQTLIAYGTKEFSFNGGEAMVSEKARSTTTIRYKLKDKTIYIE